MSSPISDVAEFFADRDVLITGGTGFLGKVLVEKLLRSVPNVKTIYLLIRSRKGQDASQRWQEIVKTCELYRSIQDAKFLDTNVANVLDKVVPINGDIMEADLGLSVDDSKTVCENVSVVFHCAATVRFDEGLRLAIQMNVEGTQRLLRLCDKMKRLDAFVHTSTAYSNCDRDRVLEHVYPSPVPWRRLVESLEWMNDEMFDLLTPLLIAARPNAYTFTKAVAESMIFDDEKTNQHLPVVMVRPSIVTAIWRDPLPGWIDNVNGATGLIALGAKGLLRSMCGDLDGVRADLIPVDIVANTLIVAAWHRGSAKGPPMPVVHCTTGELNPTTWGHMEDTMTNYFTNEMPLADLYRIPGGRTTTNRLEHRLRLFFDHLVPAYLLDLIARLSGQRPRMVRAYNKINKVLVTLEYFYTHEWHFESKGITSLNDQLSEIDRQVFNIDVSSIKWADYYHDYHGGVRKYIFKEQESNVAVAKKIHSRRRLLTRFVFVSLFSFFLFLIARIFV